MLDGLFDFIGGGVFAIFLAIVVVVLIVSYIGSRYKVAGANEAFAPSPAAVDDARGILQAWEEGKGAGVVTYNGRMVENLHVESARRILTMDGAIKALDSAGS